MLSQACAKVPRMRTDADRALAELAAEQHGVFTRRDARKLKLTGTQIRFRIEHQWTRVHDGVFRTAGAAATWRGELLAATLAAGDRSAISHRSGAALYELPRGRGDLVELSCLRWRRSRHPGLVVHESRRLEPRDINVVDSVPVLIPERIVLDLASIWPFEDYLETVVHAARRRRLITYESMRAVFERNARRGLRGVAALRSVLNEWDPGARPTDSDMETLLLQALRAHSLPEPVLQHAVHDARGSFVARPDASYPGHRIAIEYDSKQEHSDEFQLARDARRRNALQVLGYVVLSVRHDDLARGGGMACAQIAAIMRRTA